SSTSASRSGGRTVDSEPAGTESSSITCTSCSDSSEIKLWSRRMLASIPGSQPGGRRFLRRRGQPQSRFVRRNPRRAATGVLERARHDYRHACDLPISDGSCPPQVYLAAITTEKYA